MGVRSLHCHLGALFDKPTQGLLKEMLFVCVNISYWGLKKDLVKIWWNCILAYRRFTGKEGRNFSPVETKVSQVMAYSSEDINQFCIEPSEFTLISLTKSPINPKLCKMLFDEIILLIPH